MNLYVRPFDADDAEIFRKWYHDPRMYRFFRGFTNGMSIEQCKNAPEEMKFSILMGCLKTTGEAVGLFSLSLLDRVLRIYQAGALIDTQHRRKGYSIEICILGGAWAFDRLNAHKLVFKCLQDNDKLLNDMNNWTGMYHEGTSRQSAFIDGQLVDEEIYSILQSDYRKQG